MRLGRNLIAALANSFWSAFVGIAVVPLYLKYLGIEAYGLVGFFAMTQALLQILDFGLAPTLNREAARYSASSDLGGMRNLLHTVGVIYWIAAALIALLVMAAAPLVAQLWLQPKVLAEGTIVYAVVLMGLIVGCRWPIGLYVGVLTGAQRLGTVSTVGIVMTTIGNFGAVAVLALISPTIQAFFIWQVFVALIYVAIVRSVTWRIIGGSGPAHFDAQELRRIWRFSAGISGIAIVTLVLVHLDRVILSRILDLEDFGRYTMGVLIGSSLYVLLSPVFNAAYPRLSALVAIGDMAKVIDLYRYGTRLLLAVLFPIATMAAVSSEDLIVLWTGDPTLARQVAPIASFFFIGAAFNGAMHFPYALQLAHGMTRLPFLIGVILIIIFTPLTVVFATRYGGIGGAAASALINLLYLIIGTWLTHRVILTDFGLKWIMQDVGIPFVISLLIVGGGIYFTHSVSSSIALNLTIGLMFVFGAFVAILVASPNLSLTLRKYISKPSSAVL